MDYCTNKLKDINSDKNFFSLKDIPHLKLTLKVTVWANKVAHLNTTYLQIVISFW